MKCFALGKGKGGEERKRPNLVERKGKGKKRKEERAPEHKEIEERRSLYRLQREKTAGRTLFRGNDVSHLQQREKTRT